VTIANSELDGHDGSEITGGNENYGADGFPALEIENSTVTIYTTELEGGYGDDGQSGHRRPERRRGAPGPLRLGRARRAGRSSDRRQDDGGVG
jgi:hypothetical protein